MARALDIPSVVGVKDALKAIRSGDRVIVCGVTGTVTVHPTPEDEALAGARELRHRARAERLLGRQAGPAATACGVRVVLSANIELTAESELARRNGAESVGLYRTEFHYIDRVDLPGEDEQFEAYRSVVSAFDGAPVTLRTFDVGGDKFASSFQLPPEMNPALGLRAIRLAL
jgi:phosphotransferase system enzyme I (PtsI)